MDNGHMLGSIETQMWNEVDVRTLHTNEFTRVHLSHVIATKILPAHRKIWDLRYPFDIAASRPWRRPPRLNHWHLPANYYSKLQGDAAVATNTPKCDV